jgi:HK97 gp10 family phage protein
MGFGTRIDWDAGSQRSFQRAVERGLTGYRFRVRDDLRTAGIMVQNRARQLAPVDTGRLRSSIVSKVTQSTGSAEAIEVGTNVEYAPYVEFGTRHMRAQPFLRPALAEVLTYFRRR